MHFWVLMAVVKWLLLERAVVLLEGRVDYVM